MKINIGSLKQASGDRPQITVEGQIACDENNNTVLRYDIPVVALLNNVAEVKTKTGVTQGCGIVMGGVDFDFAIDATTDKGEPVTHEARLRFEPTWRGMWSGLKLHQILSTEPRQS